MDATLIVSVNLELLCTANNTAVCECNTQSVILKVYEARM